jgi:hypothetical protein
MKKKEKKRKREGEIRKKGKQNKKDKGRWGCCWWEGLSIACLLQTFPFFFSQIHFPPHLGNTSPTRVQIPKECYEQKLKQKKIRCHFMSEQKL